jgi:voltage-gated potassium channel
MSIVLLAALITACVLIHAIGMWAGLVILTKVLRQLGKPLGRGVAVGVLTVAVCGLFCLHVLHILVWAGFYQWHALLPTFEAAVYFSATSYATLGYGDVLLPERWRILGPFEAVTGVLMFGWSTGALFVLASRLYGRFFREE